VPYLRLARLVLAAASAAVAAACHDGPTRPDGRNAIVFGINPQLSRNGCSEIWGMTADGGESHQMVPSSVLMCSPPRRSRDGRRLVFGGFDAAARAFGIYVMNADGSNVTRLHTIGDLQAPTWAPRDTALTVYDGSTGGYASIRLDGTGLTPFVGPGSPFTPSWSPDGTRLLYLLSEALWVVNADGTGKRELIADAFYGRWSPNGRQIAFYGARTRSGVYLANADGSGQRQITPIDANTQISWSPDGGRIAFAPRRTALGIDDGGSEIVVMSTAGGELTRLTHVPTGQWALHPEWAPVP